MYLIRVLGLVIVAFVLLAGCAAGQPKDPNNICYILKDNKGWYKDAKKARKRWGLPVHVGFAFVHRESTFVADAKPPRKRILGVPLGRTSSAYGYAQATDEAWSDYKKDTGRRFVKRSNFEDALDFIGWYNDRSNKRLRLRKSDTYNLYLAYYNGHSGYAKGAWKKSSTIKGYAKKASRQAAIYGKQLRRCS